MDSVPSSEDTVEPTRRLVLLVHGIRTRAEWLGRLRRLFEADGRTVVEPAGYGYFDVFRFLCPIATRSKPVRIVLKKFRDALNLHQGNYDELVIVAHSFGTFIVGEILRENPEIKPNRLLLCGSILPGRYPWERLPNRPGLVLNDVGSEDIWPILASSFTWGYGATGTFGFLSPGVQDRFHAIGHSDYFREGFAEEYWVPWIRESRVLSTEYDSTARPPTKYYKNILEVLPFKWLLVAVLVWAGFLSVRSVTNRLAAPEVSRAVSLALHTQRMPSAPVRSNLAGPTREVRVQLLDVQDLLGERYLSDGRSELLLKLAAKGDQDLITELRNEGAVFDRGDFRGHAIGYSADGKVASESKVSLAGLSLRGADFSLSFGFALDFSSAELGGARFVQASLKGARFVSVNARGCVFDYAQLPAAVFRNADLEGSSFRGAVIVGADFAHAQLRDVDFSGAIVSEHLDLFVMKANTRGFHPEEWKIEKRVAGVHPYLNADDTVAVLSRIK